MKVLHVTPSIAASYGGPTYSLAGYAVASRDAGIEISIAAPRCTSAELNAFLSRAGNPEVQLFSTFGSDALATSPGLVRWVHRSGRAFDVVHVHGLFNPISSLSARVAIRSGGTVIIRPFGTLSKYTFQHRRTALKSACLRMIERRNLRNAAGLHFTTEAERKEAAWHGIDFAGRAHVVPPPSLGEGASRSAYDETQGEAMALFLGRIVPVKNIESVLDAWPEIQRTIPEAKLVIAGDGQASYLDALRKRAERNGVASGITFRGFVSGAEKERLIASATVLVLPSHHENFGIVVLEALEAGVPVIISPNVQLAEIVRAGEVGKIVPADPALLAEAITDVMTDVSIRQRVRERGPAIVARNFSAGVIGDLLSRMYRAATERAAVSNRS